MADRVVTLPAETFRVRPKPRSGRYFIVHVADSLTAMRRAMRQHLGSVHKGQLACVAQLTSTRPGEGGLLGVVFFAKTRLGAGIVAHEMAHAGFRALERDDLKLEHWRARGRRANPIEEEYAHIVEYLNIQFWREAYAKGVCTKDG